MNNSLRSILLILPQRYHNQVVPLLLRYERIVLTTLIQNFFPPDLGQNTPMATKGNTMHHGNRGNKQSYPGQGLKLQRDASMQYRAGNSSSWSSPRTLEGARLARLQSMASHLGFSRSPFFPKNIGQYANHLQQIHADRIKTEQERIRLRISHLRTVDEFGKSLKYGKFLNGKVLEFKRIDLKGMKQEVVWPYGAAKPEDEPVRKINWPTTVEAKFEGEYRVKRGLQRQLPLPKRKVDEDTAVRLINMGMKVEVALDLLHAPEEEVGAMLKDALDDCGIDELAWKQTEADVIKAEEGVYKKCLMARLEAGYGPNGIWYVDEDVPRGGHWFDEEAIRHCGKWAEILNELNGN